MTMPKKKPRKTMSQLIPTVWFVDLANLLIFYFLATTSLNKVKGIEADIPSGQQSTTSAAKMDSQPQVVVDGDSIRLNGTKMSMEELIEQLNKYNLKEKQGEEKVVFFEMVPLISNPLLVMSSLLLPLCVKFFETEMFAVFLLPTKVLFKRVNGSGPKA
jgi:biopolymer transport protein ExbD